MLWKPEMSSGHLDLSSCAPLPLPSDKNKYKVTSRYLIKDAKAAVACVKSISAKLKNQMKNIMQRTLQYSP